MRRISPKSLVLICLATVALAACEGVAIDDPQPRPNHYGGRGAGAGGAG